MFFAWLRKRIGTKPKQLSEPRKLTDPTRWRQVRLCLEGLETRDLLSGATSTLLSSSAATTVYGLPVTLTATVSVVPPATGTPTGTVTFEDSGVSVGTGALNGVSGNDLATLVLSSLPAGQHFFTASYGGDSTFGGSDSGSPGVTPSSIITTFAGNGGFGYNGDNIPATTAQVDHPNGMAVDAAGDVFIADTLNNRVREVIAATGQIITVAGTGIAGYNGDNQAATTAELDGPYGVALDALGDLFIADFSNHRVREVQASTHQILTVAGTGTIGYNGDNQAATAAELSGPENIAVDAAGDLFIADSTGNRVREVPASTHQILTIAGTGTAGYNGDNQAAISAELNYPSAVAVDPLGDVFIADQLNNRVREVSAGTGKIATVAGTGAQGYNGDNQSATAAQLNWPTGVAVDATGHLFIADSVNYRIREVSAGLITTVAGAATFTGGYNGDNQPATAALLALPSGVALDAAGDVFIADTNNTRVREVSAGTGVISTVAGTFDGYSGENQLATASELGYPSDVAVTAAGDIFFVDSYTNRVLKVSASTGLITTVAGNGFAGYNGDNQLATAATLNSPQGLFVDAAGNLFIADTKNNRIREVSASTGLISTVAGTGASGYHGDNVAATAATLSNPFGVAEDAAGNLFIADSQNNRVREVSAVTGKITTFAGTGTRGYNGDNRAASAAELSFPTGVTLDAAGDLFIADQDNNRVREVSAVTGKISTVAGTGTQAYNGDNLAGTAAALSLPARVAVDAAGDIFIADAGNFRVREVLAGSGLIATVAGTGGHIINYNGDNQAATAADLNNPYGVAVNAAGDLFIADENNHRVREVSALVLLTVNRAATTTTLTDNGPTPSTTAQTVSLTANVAGGVPDGESVILEDADNSNGQVGSAGTLASGSVTIMIPVNALTVGTHHLFAVYAGDANYSSSQSAQVAQVVNAPTPITIASIVVNGNPSAAAVRAITSASETVDGSCNDELVTITTAGNNGFVSGQLVTISGLTGYNGCFPITMTDATDFTYVDPTFNLGPVTNTGTASNALSGNQRSMVDSIVYTFNQPVNLDASPATTFTIAKAANVIVTGGSPTTVGTLPTLSWSNPSGDGVTWVVSFSGAGVLGSGSMADGVYSITLNNSHESAVSGGGTLPSNDTEEFYRLTGDALGFVANGNQATVMTADLTQFTNALNKNPGPAPYRAYFDFLGAGTNDQIGTADLTQFTNRLSKLTYSGFTPTI